MPTARFAHDLASTEQARRFVAEELQRRDVGEDALFRIQVLVTELVSNAIRHAGSGVELTVTSGDEVIRIEARDESTARPAPAPLDGPTRHRGLLLVEDLSQRWGVDMQAHPGKVVWCEVSPGSRVDERTAVRS